MSNVAFSIFHFFSADANVWGSFLMLKSSFIYWKIFQVIIVLVWSCMFMKIYLLLCVSFMIVNSFMTVSCTYCFLASCSMSLVTLIKNLICFQSWLLTVKEIHDDIICLRLIAFTMMGVHILLYRLEIEISSFISFFWIPYSLDLFYICLSW